MELSREEILYSAAEKGTTSGTKCPGCGANLSFHPEKESLWCLHCDNEVKFPTAPAIKLEFARLLDPANKWTDTHVFQCSRCGAKEILSREEIAKACAFCGTSNIVQASDISGIKPNAVLPFKITKETAITRFINWVKKKFFAPRRFKKNVRAEEVDGIYNPAFTFDTDTITQYRGRLGRRVTYTTRVNGRTVTRTRIDYINISGTYSGLFNDILIQASSTIQQKDVNKMQPFDMFNSKEYNQNFLFGYAANQYSKDGTTCWGEARAVIDERIKRAILQKYPGYTIVAEYHANTVYNNIMFRYVLLPVYVGHCNYGKKFDKIKKEKVDKTYNFYVNGTNGKVAGKMPVSAPKVLMVVGIVLGAVVGALAGITKAMGWW
ncbi:MAG: hypothetical protein FWH03_08360 [Firmicutes bacterium]|nr:hypothetical protein [Bacillota bacterium]